MKTKSVSGILLFIILSNISVIAQTKDITIEAKNTMLKATSTWLKMSYEWWICMVLSPGFLSSWGELEAYKSQIWLQGPGGTIDMGNMFLDAYNATGNEYYYQAAEKVAQALILGQLYRGGWNYFIDFNGILLWRSGTTLLAKMPGDLKNFIIIMVMQLLMMV